MSNKRMSVDSVLSSKCLEPLDLDQSSDERETMACSVGQRLKCLKDLNEMVVCPFAFAFGSFIDLVQLMGL